MGVRSPVAGAWLLAIAGHASAGHSTYYVNPESLTSAAFPTELFNRELPETYNGNGKSWASDDGAWLGVFGYFDVADVDVLAQRAAERQGKAYEVVWVAKGRRWTSIYARSTERMYHARFEVGAYGMIHAFELSYPASQAATYDPVSISIADSLQGP